MIRIMKALLTVALLGAAVLSGCSSASTPVAVSQAATAPAEPAASTPASAPVVAITPSSTTPVATADATPAAASNGSSSPETISTPASTSVPKHWWYPNWSSSGVKGTAAAWLSSWPQPKVFTATGHGPLSGHTILIDPGHNIGNSTHTSQINRHYWVGLDKICNTTGTATDHGFPEATYTFDVAQRLTRILTAAGAKVVLTRDQNSHSTYGPCIQARGLLGGEVGADLGVSIHADGGPSSGHGAFVYSPGVKPGYTSSSKAKQSYRLAGDVLKGLAAHGQVGSTYLHPNIAPDQQQGTLNVASIPIVIVETLNMRNAGDAAKAESASGRQSIAAGLAAGIERWIAGR